MTGRADACRKGGAMRRIATTIAAVALAGWLAGTPAGAEDVHGTAMIHEVQLASSAVVLDGEVYLVTDATRLEDEQGFELSLAQLPSVAGGASGDEAAVFFVAEEPAASGRNSRLRHLQLTGAMPK